MSPIKNIEDTKHNKLRINIQIELTSNYNFIFNLYFREYYKKYKNKKECSKKVYSDLNNYLLKTTILNLKEFSIKHLIPLNIGYFKPVIEHICSIANSFTIRSFFYKNDHDISLNEDILNFLNIKHFIPEISKENKPLVLTDLLPKEIEKNSDLIRYNYTIIIYLHGLKEPIDSHFNYLKNNVIEHTNNFIDNINSLNNDNNTLAFESDKFMEYPIKENFELTFTVDNDFEIIEYLC